MVIPGAKCEQWKRECKIRTLCTQRSLLAPKCFNCIQFPPLGSAAKVTSIHTCKTDEVHQYQLHNYRCDPVYDSAPCQRSIQTNMCQWKCVKRPTGKSLGINLDAYDTHQ